MEILRRTLRGSPFVGVFCCITEKTGLFPLDAGVSPKEIKDIEELFGIEVIRAKIADSSLLGILAVGNSNGFVLGEIATEKELQHLKGLGLRVKKISGVTAIGNLLEANDSKGICSPTIKPKIQREIAEFLKIELREAKIGNSDLAGSSLVATNKGFVISTRASEKEFADAKKFFGLNGSSSTANYGDAFIGNSLAANSRAAIAGIRTSGVELVRIDEGLGGE
ncbi:MAG TPA: translation initiation factor IF-6 [archaeon]|nr:translation initiation factor IF-6 [archaeon]